MKSPQPAGLFGGNTDSVWDMQSPSKHLEKSSPSWPRTVRKGKRKKEGCVSLRERGVRVERAWAHNGGRAVLVGEVEQRTDRVGVRPA